MQFREIRGRLTRRWGWAMFCIVLRVVIAAYIMAPWCSTSPDWATDILMSFHSIQLCANGEVQQESGEQCRSSNCSNCCTGCSSSTRCWSSISKQIMVAVAFMS